MHQCLKKDPKERPTFSEIQEILAQIIKEENGIGLHK